MQNKRGNDFLEAFQKVQYCYDQRDYNKAIELLKKLRNLFPEEADCIYHHLAWYSAYLGKYEEAIAALEEAHAKGVWWWPDDDFSDFYRYFEPLKQNPRFQHLAEKNQKRYEAIRKSTSFKWLLHEPLQYNSTKTYPLLIAFHQSYGNIEECKTQWQEILNLNMLLGLVQSSQIISINGYGWMDLNKGLNDVTHSFSELKRRYSSDFNQILVGGVEMGGTIALKAGFEQNILPVNGIIAVNPHISAPSKFISMIALSRHRNIKCWIIIEYDDECYYETIEFTSLLEETGIKVYVDEIKSEQIVNYFPQDFNKRLHEKLPFFLE